MWRMHIEIETRCKVKLEIEETEDPMREVFYFLFFRRYSLPCKVK